MENSTLIIATHNAHKTEEIRAILGSRFSAVQDLNEFPEIEEAVEDGDSFHANSAIKALAASAAIPDATILADDSGLEVDALDGDPGVHSARYAGQHGDDAANRLKLLEELAATGMRGKKRSARFRCVLTLATGGKVLADFDGAVEGIITNREKGENGFGYDSIFVPDGYCETFAELPASTKNELSHRSRALDLLIDWLDTKETATHL